MKRYSLAQLEAFDRIRTLGTFGAAAAALNITQPTISLRIRELETALGVRLFERRGRGPVRLSAEGEVFAEYVSQGLALLQDMEEQLRSSDPLHGTLRLGTSDMIAITCLTEILNRMEARHPRLKIELQVTNSVELTERLNTNKLDIALLAEQRARPHVAIVPLALAELGWVGSAHQRLPGKVLRPSDLQRVKVLTAPPSSPLNSIIHEWCASHRSPMPAVSTCNSVAVIARLVTSGMAMSLLPTCVLQDELASGKVIRYRQRVELEPLRLCAAYRTAAKGAGLDGVLRIARDVMARSGLFEMLPATA